jgi:Transglutaminase-like superfamily
MKRLCKFLSLSPIEQRLLLQAALWLGLITLGLRVFSFQTIRRWLAGMARGPVVLTHTQPSPEQVTWGVRVASRYIPVATCLPQALAAQMLLKQKGYPAFLRVGIAKGEQGQLEAHAWVESYGQIIIGDLKNLGRYTQLPSLEVENP